MIEFLIVGGGIGGAVLAHLLARQGRQVLVLERETSPRHVIRPEILWPATARILEPILTSLAASDWQIPIQGLRAFTGNRPLFEVDAQTFRKSGVEPHSTDPNATRAGLLADPAFAVERGVEMIELLRQGDRVSGVRVRDTATGATRELSARWVVGDDGAHSRVREGCGIALAIRSLPLDLACFEFDWPARLPPAVAHVVLNPLGTSSGIAAMGGVPLPLGRAIGLVALRRPQSEQDAIVNEGLRALDAADTPIAGLLGGRRFPDDFRRFRPQFGHAARYGVPGAVLMGDAAHPVTPAGGQGANMAIADAVALAECARERDDDLVARYELRRRLANERSVSISRSVSRVLRLPGWLLGNLAPPLIRWLGRNPDRAARVLHRFSTAFLDDAG